MARNSSMVPENQDKLGNFKSEVASSLNINLKQGYNGDLTSREAGSIGGKAYASNNMAARPAL